MADRARVAPALFAALDFAADLLDFAADLLDFAADLLDFAADRLVLLAARDFDAADVFFPPERDFDDVDLVDFAMAAPSPERCRS